MFVRLRRLFQKKPPAKETEQISLPKNVGEVWHIIQKIAEEEDRRYAEKNVVEHVNSSAEALKDIDRWLHIYRRRVDPKHVFRFPDHRRRYRGHCLVPRNWPDGLSWDAFHEETWFRAPLPGQPNEESLVHALDAFLEKEEDSGNGQ